MSNKRKKQLITEYLFFDAATLPRQIDNEIEMLNFLQTFFKFLQT